MAWECARRPSVIASNESLVNDFTCVSSEPLEQANIDGLTLLVSLQPEK